MSYRLTVYTPDKETFNAYFYGYGYVTEQFEVELHGRPRIKTVIDYGDDHYRCEYQAGRFASGLHFAEVTED